MATPVPAYLTIGRIRYTVEPEPWSGGRSFKLRAPGGSSAIVSEGSNHSIYCTCFDYAFYGECLHVQALVEAGFFAE